MSELADTIATHEAYGSRILAIACMAPRFEVALSIGPLSELEFARPGSGASPVGSLGCH